MVSFVSKTMYFLLALVALPRVLAADISNEALTAHNDFRALHGASPLTWNEDLAAAANSWASRCVMEHSKGQVGDFGETLSAGAGGGFTVTAAFNVWTNEYWSYKPEDPENTGTLDFTQVVWKSSEELGCAFVECPAGTIFQEVYGIAQFLVCEYHPPGNVAGQFGQNVQM